MISLRNIVLVVVFGTLLGLPLIVFVNDISRKELTYPEDFQSLGYTRFLNLVERQIGLNLPHPSRDNCVAKLEGGLAGFDEDYEEYEVGIQCVLGGGQYDILQAYYHYSKFGELLYWQKGE